MKRWGLAAWACVMSTALVRADLTIANIQARYGASMLACPDQDYQAGDTVAYSFDVAGLPETGPAAIQLKATFELLDAQGRLREYRLVPIEAALKFGRQPCRMRAQVTIPKDAEVGDYVYRVTLKDAATLRDEASFVRPVRVRPPAFRIGDVAFMADRDGAAALGGCVTVGQTVWLHSYVQGFTMVQDVAALKIRFRVEDTTTQREVFVEEKESRIRGPLPADVRIPSVVIAGEFVATRAGRFVIHVHIADMKANVVAEARVPLQVAAD